MLSTRVKNLARSHNKPANRVDREHRFATGDVPGDQIRLAGCDLSVNGEKLAGSGTCPLQPVIRAVVTAYILAHFRSPIFEEQFPILIEG